MKYKIIKQIELADWNKFICETYKKTYCLQLQEGCRQKQSLKIIVPVENPIDYENHTILENVENSKRGVSFESWLKRDPKQKLSNKHQQGETSLRLWWQRNFYPHIDMIINDLHKRKLLKSGEYVIEIDWG